MRVPDQYATASLRDFNNPILDRVVSGAERRLVLLQGRPGCGKTRALYAIARETATPPGSHFVVVPELMLSLQSTAGVDMDRVRHRIHDLKHVRGVLLLDDLGTEGRVTDFVLQCLYLIIAHREKWGLPTVVTSNLSMGQIAERFGDRLASRLSGGIVIEFKGRDRRLGD